MHKTFMVLKVQNINKPIFKVTVMMFRDIVESVTLLNDDAWNMDTI